MSENLYFEEGKEMEHRLEIGYWLEELLRVAQKLCLIVRNLVEHMKSICPKDFVNSNYMA